MPSNVIKTFSYDAAAKELTVEFRSGRIYIYEDVPEEVAVRMKSTFSKGEFFNAHVRDRFSFRRVDVSDS